MLCSNCGTPINKGAKFCSKCGTVVPAVEKPIIKTPETAQRKETAVKPASSSTARQKNKPPKVWFILSIVVLAVLWGWIFFKPVSEYTMNLNTYFIWSLIFVGLMLIAYTAYYIIRFFALKKGAKQ